MEAQHEGRRSVRFAAELTQEVRDQLTPTDSEVLVTDSIRSTGSGSSKSSGGLKGGKNLRSNMMRQQKDRDPLFYYEIIKVVGVGSMGSVAMVKKRAEVVGGSARQDVVESFKRQKREEECFSIPIFGPFFEFCVKKTGMDASSHSSSSSVRSRKNIFHSTDTTNTDASAEDDTSSVSRRTSANIVYAMKSIHLNRVKDDTFIEELKNEIEILKKLDHPHIVRPIETFYHRNQIFIVMENCSGGDLYSRDPYTEEEAARIVSSVLSAVAYMHHKSICHRDIKYENILFISDDRFAEVKLIDFGLSKKYIAGQNMTEGVGTIYTMAPEVLKGTYTAKADLWSIGVVAYMLLSSQMPFYGRKRRHIVEQIMRCQYDFKGRRWKRVSQQAKEFVQDLLVMDPMERPTAEEAMSNMWLNRRHTATMRAPTLSEVEESSKSLKAFAGYSKLKKLSLMVVAHKSTAEEIGILRKIFQQYDTLKNGTLNFDEFRGAMEQYGHSEEELEEMFEAVDLDGTGKIRYTEFLAATIEAQGAISEERLAEAFDRLDSDDSGYISAENLAEMLGDDFPKEDIKAIIAECDLTRDNRISYSEFLALWEEKGEKRRESLLETIVPLDPGTLSGLSSDYESDLSTRSLKEEMIADSESERETVARANFIEGKHISGRKAQDFASLGPDEGKKILFAENVEIIGEKAPKTENSLVDPAAV